MPAAIAEGAILTVKWQNIGSVITVADLETGCKINAR